MQKVALAALEKKIDEKIKLLEAREAEVKSWVEKQKTLRESATESLVAIYAGMDAEVAAKQLAGLDAKLASSVLRQLKPRVASAILNEMKPETANLLVRTIASAAARETASP
jgi:flagellar motility protein MotE (MotC chaperone)